MQRLQPAARFTARALFGEFVLYADGKVVALICDNLVYVKIVRPSRGLDGLCEKGVPYPGANPHYIVEEGQFITLPNLSAIFFDVAAWLPESKTKKKTARRVISSVV